MVRALMRNAGYKISHEHGINCSNRSPAYAFCKASCMRRPLAMNSAKRNIIPNPLMQVVQNDLREDFRDTNLDRIAYASGNNIGKGNGVNGA